MCVYPPGVSVRCRSKSARDFGLRAAYSRSMVSASMPSRMAPIVPPAEPCRGAYTPAKQMETDSRTATRPGIPEQVVGVVHYGLGPIGRAVAALVAERQWLRSVAAVDMADDLRGSQLGDVIGRPSPGYPSLTQELPTARGA